MDPLSGIDGSRPSPPQARNMTRRGSSISLEDGPVPAQRPSTQTQHSGKEAVYNPAKPPLLLFRPQELHTPTTIREASPEDGCPLLPSEPSLPSSPLVTKPMDVFLWYEDRHEMMRLGGVAPVAQPSPELAESSLGASSWQHINVEDAKPSPDDEAGPSKYEKTPRTPVPAPRTESSYVLVDMVPMGPIEVEENPPETTDSDIPSLSLSTSRSQGIDVGVRKYRGGKRAGSVSARTHRPIRRRKEPKDLKGKR